MFQNITSIKILLTPGDDEVLKDEKLIDKIQREVEHYNEGFGKWEQIKKYELIKGPFTIHGGELTPTLKLKRKAILAKYKPAVDSIYGTPTI